MTKQIKTIIGIFCLLLTIPHYAATSHEYLLKFDPGLSKVEVTINLAHRERTLKAANTNSGFFLQEAKDCQSKESISYQDKRLLLKPENLCINYSIRLQQINEARFRKVKNKLIVSRPSEWLFLPRIRSDEKIVVNVEYPDALEFSVPWEPSPSSEKTFYIKASPNSGSGLLIYGEFVSEKIKHQGTELRVAYLPGKPVDKNMISTWLKNTVDNVSLSYGQFPHPNPQIIIIPSSKSWSRQRSPVPFGRVVRDYGESVHFFIDERQSLSQFNKDWTATHEFGHLLLPYISWRNRWLSEGFASYYQNILMARAGNYTEQYAWQKLYDGFMRGKKSSPELSPNVAARDNWTGGSNMKVYWSGAALFFIADVQLRQQSNNTKSLDTTLMALKDCCLPSTKSWTGSQIMRQLDSLSDSSIFSDLYDDYANNSEFPAFEKAFNDLGIQIRAGKVRFDEEDNNLLRKNIINKKSKTYL